MKMGIGTLDWEAKLYEMILLFFFFDKNEMILLAHGCFGNFNDMEHQLSGSNPSVTGSNLCVVFIRSKSKAEYILRPLGLANCRVF